MSIFTKLGKTIKKGVKQISLKNLVKVGTPFLGMIPIVGGGIQSSVEGLSASNEAKKQAKIAIAQGNIALAQSYETQASALAQNSGVQVGNIVAQTIIKPFAKGATDELIAQTSESVKESAGTIGATVTDLTIKAWFEKHLVHIGIVLAFLIGLYMVLRKKAGKMYRNGASSSLKAHYASNNVRNNRPRW